MTKVTEQTALRKAVESALQRRHDEDLQKALAAVEVLETLGVSVRLDGEALESVRPRAAPRRTRRPKRGHESLADAIDRVLVAEDRWMTVVEIGRALVAEGRDFGKSRPEAFISSVVTRRAESRGWIHDDKRPKRWRKAKGGGST